MNKHEIPLDPARKAQLVAAAYVLVGWVHTTRASWPRRSDESDSGAGADADFNPNVDPDFELPAPAAAQPYIPPVVEAPLHFEAAAAVDRMPAAYLPEPVEYLPEPVEEERIPEPKPAKARKPRAEFRLPNFNLPIGAMVRYGKMAAILALVVGGGWAARPYVTDLFSTPPTGTAVIDSVPPSEVLVDGVSMGTAPLTAELSTGHHVIGFRRSSGLRTVEIDVVGGKSTTASYDWNAIQFGRLTATSAPPGARVLIDGTERGVTPLTLDDVPVGSHTVLIESSQGSVQRTVTVSTDTVAAINESLFPGWLKVFAPFELQIMDGVRAVRLDEQSQVMLTAGVHELRFENRALGYSETRRIEVKPGQTASLSLTPSPSSLTVVSNVPATVLIDGAQVGETPLSNHAIALGTRDIIVRSAAGDERRFTTPVTVSPVSLDVTF